MTETVHYPDLQGRCAVITGGASGIGRACASELAKNGAKVAVLDLPAQASAASAAIVSLETLGVEALAVEADVRDVSSIQRAVDQIRSELGPPQIWVNNAGSVVRKPALEVSEDEWDRVVDVCLRGAFFCSRLAAESMRQNGGGNIINMASVYGLIGGRNRAAYAASKAGLVNLTRVLALEWREYAIRVNAIAPCFVRTPMTEKLLGEGLDVPNRAINEDLANPEDVGHAVCFLASDFASGMITGHALPVDGGWTAW